VVAVPVPAAACDGACAEEAGDVGTVRVGAGRRETAPGWSAGFAAWAGAGRVRVTRFAGA
jgi:hypothetical protein